MVLTLELRRDIEERISKIKDHIDAVWPPTNLKELDEWVDLHRQWDALERLLSDERHTWD
jgi:hypothetical protein